MAWGLYPPHSPGEEILWAELALLVVTGSSKWTWKACFFRILVERAMNGLLSVSLSTMRAPIL